MNQNLDKEMKQFGKKTLMTWATHPRMKIYDAIEHPVTCNPKENS